MCRCVSYTVIVGGKIATENINSKQSTPSQKWGSPFPHALEAVLVCLRDHVSSPRALELTLYIHVYLAKMTCTFRVYTRHASAAAKEPYKTIYTHTD